MNANEARKITNQNKIKNSRAPKIQEGILESASKGLDSYTLLGKLSEDDAFMLRGMGYKIVYYPQPDSRDPRESDYTTISW